MTTASITGRRQPPAFRCLTVSRLEQLGPRMVRVTVTGDALRGFSIDQPAASVRMLVPTPGSPQLVIPTWNGNEFLLADGTRPIIRTFTPRRLTPRGLDLEIVIHPDGAVSSWAETAHPGAEVAVSGPGRGYEIDAAASGYVLVGDETAIPAIGQLLEHVHRQVPVVVDLVVRNGFGRVGMPEHPEADVTWHELWSPEEMGETMVAALGANQLDTKAIWCAGEASAMHVVRKYLFEDLDLERARATVRGYWKARG